MGIRNLLSCCGGWTRSESIGSKDLSDPSDRFTAARPRAPAITITTSDGDSSSFGTTGLRQPRDSASGRKRSLKPIDEEEQAAIRRYKSLVQDRKPSELKSLYFGEEGPGSDMVGRRVSGGGGGGGGVQQQDSKGKASSTHYGNDSSGFPNNGVSSGHGGLVMVSLKSLFFGPCYPRQAYQKLTCELFWLVSTCDQRRFITVRLCGNTGGLLRHQSGLLRNQSGVLGRLAGKGISNRRKGSCLSCLAKIKRGKTKHVVERNKVRDWFLVWAGS